MSFGLYSQSIKNSKKNLAYSTASSPNTPFRQLSFQGRLTDSAGNAIASSTSIVFRLYDSPTSDIGTSLYTSDTGNSQVVVPTIDDNGIFSVVIGKSHGTEIPESVFSEHNQVFLEITVNDEIMSPRQPIATVAYALNSETLQGLPPSSSGLKNTVMVIDDSGHINLGETTPTIIASSDSLRLEGQGLILQASDGSGGDITINPDAGGILDLSFELNAPVTGGFIDASADANMTSGNLFYGQVLSNYSNNYNFLQFQNYNIGTTQLATRFSIGASGDIYTFGSVGIGITNPTSLLNIAQTTQALGDSIKQLVSNNAVSISGTYGVSGGSLPGYIWNTTDNNITKPKSGVWTNVSADGSSLLFGISDSYSGGITRTMQFTYGGSNGAGLLDTPNLQTIGLNVIASATIGTTLNTTTLVATNSGSTTVVTNLNADYLDGFHYNNLPYEAPLTFNNGLTRSINTVSLGGTLNQNTSIGTSSFNLSFIGLNGTQSLFISSSGNIGIGTTDPQYKLDVGGTLNATTIFQNGAPLSFSNQLITLTGDVGGSGTTSIATTIQPNSVALSTDTTGNYVSSIIGNSQISVAGSANENVGVSLSITNDSIGDAQLAFNTGQHLTTSSSPIFTKLGLGNTSASYTLNVIGNGYFSTNLNIGSSLTIGSIPTLTDNNLVLSSNSGIISSINTTNWDKSSADDYTGWILQGSGANSSNVSTGSTINFTGTGAASVSKSGNTITINSSVGATNTYFAGSGLTLSSTTFRLGGALTENMRLNIGNTESLYIQYTTGNVGIGTTNPTSKLHVVGNANITTNLTIGGTFVSVGSTNLVTNLNADLLDGLHASSFINIGQTGSLPYDNYNHWKLQANGLGTTNILTGNTINFVNGIGISLSQSGSAITISNVGVGTTYTAGSGLTLSSSQFKLGGALTENMRLNIGNTESLYIQYSSGNIGIGTTNPGALLHISSTSNSQVIPIIQSADTVSSTSGFVFRTPWSSTNYDGAIYSSFYGNTIGNHAIQGMTFVSPRDNTNWGLRFNSNNGTTRLFVNTNNGNIGIGTTNPLALLHLEGDNKSLQIRDTNPAKAVLMLNANSTETSIISTYGAGGSTVPLTFKITSTESMRINTNGNVGIGTTNPWGKLHIMNLSAGSTAANINGDDLIVESGTAGGISIITPDNQYGSLYFASPSDSQSAYISSAFTDPNFYISTDKANGTIQFRTGLSVNAVKIDSSGNVGIGTTNPSSKLHVLGNIKLSDASPQFIADNGSTHLFSFIRNNTVANADMAISTYGGIGFATGETGGPETGADYKMYLKSTGNVGIGTTNPTDKLQVAGNILPGANLTYDIGSSGYRWNNTWTKILNIGSSTWSLQSPDNSRLSFFNNSVGGTETFTILNTGNMGIGTTDPSFKLEVIGDVAASKFADWANPIYFLSPANSDSTNNSLSLYKTGSIRFNFNDVSNTNPVIGAASRIQNFDNGLLLAVGTGSTAAGQSVTGWNNQLFLNNSGNVGIGTTNPTKTLDIVGTEKVSSGLQVNNVFIGGGITVPGCNNYADQICGNTNLWLGAATGGKIYFEDLVNDIGVSESIITGTYLRVDNNNTNNGTPDLYFGNVGTAEGIGSKRTAGGNALGLDLYTSSTARLSITNTGNVGIGTTNPGTNLDVVGTIRTYGTTGSPGIVIGSHATATSSTGGQEGLQTFYDFTNHNLIQRSVGWGSSFYDQTFQGRNIYFQNGTGSTSNSLMIASGGNVGIGTTSPQASLDILTSDTSTNIRSALRLSRTDSDSAGAVNLGTSIDFSLEDATSTLRQSSQIGSYWTYINAGTYGSDLTFSNVVNDGSNNLRELMRLSRYGRVGIGATSPLATLHVKAGITGTDHGILGQSSWAGFAGVWGQNDATDGYAVLGSSTNGFGIYGSSTNGFAGYFSGKSAFMDGNVGIGTTNPGAKLDILAGNNYTGLKIRGNSSLTGDWTGINFTSWADGSGYFSAIRHINKNSSPSYLEPRLGFFTQNTDTYLESGLVERLSILANSGNVGIGTPSPDTTLDVHGSVKVGTNGGYSLNNGGISLGDTTSDYTPTTGNWTSSGSTLLINASTYSTIGFHDSGNRVDFIRVGNNNMELGYNAGWGSPTVVVPGHLLNTNIGGVNGIGDQESMIPNSGFEINTDANTLDPDGWYPTMSGSSRAVNGSSSQGEYNFSITSSSGTWGNMSSACVPISGGRQYNLMINGVSNQNSGDGFYLRLSSYTTKSNCINNTSPYDQDAVSNGQMTSAAWQIYGATITTSTSYHWARVWIYNYLPNAAGNTIMYYDSLRLIPVSDSIGIDLAENYPVSDIDTPEPGDIVTLGDSSSEGIAYAIKTTKKYDPNTFGIISTQPGLILDDFKPYKKAQVALAGRVPTKVSLENGPIFKGDRLTSSSIPGVAMKSTKASYVIATALESFDGSNYDSEINGQKIGKITTLIKPSFYDPDLQLASTGEVQVNYNVSSSVLSSLGYTDTKNEIESAEYYLNDSIGNLVDRIGQFKEIISAKIKTGLLIANNIVSNRVITDTSISKETKTNLISPLSGESLPIIINSDASVSGTLSARDLRSDKLTSTEATISTLYADNIISSQITSLREQMQKLIAGNIASTSPFLQGGMSEGQGGFVADLPLSETDDLQLTNNLIVGVKLTVSGDTQLGNAFITGTFTTGEIAIKDNFIETTNTALYIQPSGLGSVHILKDILIIADSGDVTINGNLALNGSLTTQTASISGSLIANMIKAQEASFDKISISTSSAQTIIADSGFANLASSSAELTSNATAGTATLPAGKTELIIHTSKLTSNSLIYLTPVGFTDNQVFYVKDKSKDYFTIALKSPLTTNVDINWWIIN